MLLDIDKLKPLMVRRFTIFAIKFRGQVTRADNQVGAIGLRLRYSPAEAAAIQQRDWGEKDELQGSPIGWASSNDRRSRLRRNRCAYKQSGDHRNDMLRRVSQPASDPGAVSANDKQGLNDDGQLNQVDDGEFEAAEKSASCRIYPNDP